MWRGALMTPDDHCDWSRPSLAGSFRADGRTFLLRYRILVRIDRLAAFELRGINDDFGFGVAEVIDAVPLDVLELRSKRPLLRPFARRAEFHLANHGVERVLVHVGGEHIVF